jgi:hypothetical protein
MRTRLTFALSLLLVSKGVCAADAPSAPVPPELIAANKAVLDAEPKSGGVFALQPDGSIKHVQSGLVCPARYPNVHFGHAFVYASDGSDVGCDYLRANAEHDVVAKLTLFAVRADPSLTVDQAFAKYRAEVLQTFADARSLGESLHVEDKSKDKSAVPDVRSEEFAISVNGAAFTTVLIVTVKAGWSIEVRGTYAGLPNQIEINAGGVNSAVDAMGDRLMATKALFDAAGSVNSGTSP